MDKLILLKGSISCPDYLTHYYEKSRGPFHSLSDLPLSQAEGILGAIREEGITFASKRVADYLIVRHGLEEKIRALFRAKGGMPQKKTPHYFILGTNPWLLSWFREGAQVQIPISEINPETVSFTYGDSFPAMRIHDGKPYRGMVYTLDELPELIRNYGLPQEWNPDGRFGPERYIEAQVWADEPVWQFLSMEEE